MSHRPNNLTQMKSAILRKGREWNGLIVESEHYKHGDRFGRITPIQAAFNQRVHLALEEMESDGVVERIDHNSFRIVEVA